MKRVPAIVLALVVVILGGVFYLTKPGTAPAGQPPLVEITGPALDSLQTEFNRTSSSLRIVLLLSPT